jgi:hypothetical protein
MPDIINPAAAPADVPPVPSQPPISLLSIRRHYWETTHGWRVPASSPEAPVIDMPGRVA